MLLSVPVEIQRQILEYAVPRGETYRLESRKAYIKDKFDLLERLSEWHAAPEFVKYPYEPRRYIKGANDSPRSCLSLLLIHFSLTPWVMELVLANNSFSFPDAFTVRSFADQLGPVNRAHLTSMSVDGRGRVAKTEHYSCIAWSFKHKPDHDIVSAVALYPGLRELRLGGIGPDCGSRAGGGLWCNTTRWSLDAITMVAGIVGTERSTDVAVGEATGPLKGGRVSSAVALDSRGLAELEGVRIVKSGCSDLPMLSTEVEYKSIADILESVVRGDPPVMGPWQRYN